MDKEKELELQADEPASARVDERGHRRGRNPFAALVGGFIGFLSIVGAVSIVIGGIRWVRHAADTTALKEEFYYYLEPVLAYTPEPFDNIAVAPQQDAFLDAAAYRISITEQVRMMQEQQKNSSAEVTCKYPVDDLGRIAVPIAEIEASYRALFGPDAPLTHRSVEANNLTYSAADKCYYVPFNDLMTNYRPVIESVKRKASSYTVRVGFVANNDIVIDDHGNEVPPTADMASYFQTYTFTRTDKDHYYISSCKNE